MSIKLYWGANGAYKSASAVQDDIIPELKKGRHVYTNIRGCTLDKVLEVFPNLPEGADVTYIDTSKPGAIEELRQWPWKAPKGSLVVLDEIQLIYPRAWTAKKYEELYNQFKTFDEAEQAGEPFNLLDGFTRHRHWNFDVVMTTPSIKMVRSEIRDTTEVAYRQANMALIGIKGKFKRAMHPADENKPGRDSLVETKKIKAETFRCYQSTATGQVQDTRSGTNLFKSPRLLFALAFSALSFSYAFFNGGLEYFTSGGDLHAQEETVSAPEPSEKVVDVDIQEDSPSPPVDVSAAMGGEPFDDFDIVVGHAFDGMDIRIIGSLEGERNGEQYRNYMFRLFPPDASPFSLYSRDMQLSGYEVVYISSCHALLMYEGGEIPVFCGLPGQAL